MLYTILVLFLSFVAFSCNGPCSAEPFPVPSGSYTVAVAYRSYVRPASLRTAADRPLGISIWYPIAGESNSPPASYCNDANLIKALRQEQYLNLSDSILHDWKKLKTAAIPASMEYLPLTNIPTLLFSPGLGMTRINYTTIAIEIASHGYLVAAIDHPGSGITVLPDGKAMGVIPNSGGPDGKVEELCRDASFIVKELLTDDLFKNSIAPNALAMAGHSLGGAAALNVAAYDHGFKAAINLDGYLFGKAMHEGIAIPFLGILQRPQFPEGNTIPDSLKMERSGLWREIARKSKPGSTVVRIDGMMHFDFTDLPFIIPDSLRVKNGGTLPADRGHQLVSGLMLAFLEQYLKNKDPEALGEFIAANKELENEIDACK